MTKITRCSTVELREQLAGRSVSAVELMEETLDRIHTTHEQLGAVVTLRDREALLADARAADDRRASGDTRALLGIPLGVKDLEDADCGGSVCTLQ